MTFHSHQKDRDGSSQRIRSVGESILSGSSNFLNGSNLDDYERRIPFHGAPAEKSFSSNQSWSSFHPAMNFPAEIGNNSSLVLLRSFPNHGDLSSIRANSSDSREGRGTNSTIYSQSSRFKLRTNPPNIYSPVPEINLDPERQNNLLERSRVLDDVSLAPSPFLPGESERRRNVKVESAARSADKGSSRFAAAYDSEDTQPQWGPPREVPGNVLKSKIKEFQEAAKYGNKNWSGSNNSKVIRGFLNLLIEELGPGVFAEFTRLMNRKYPGSIVPSPKEMMQQHSAGYYDPLLSSFLVYENMDQFDFSEKEPPRKTFARGPLGAEEINRVFTYDELVKDRNRLGESIKKHQTDSRARKDDENERDKSKNAQKAAEKPEAKPKMSKSEFSAKLKTAIHLTPEVRVVLKCALFACSLLQRCRERTRIVCSDSFLQRWNTKINDEYQAVSKSCVEFFTALNPVVIPLLNEKRNMILCPEVEKKVIPKQEMQKRAELVKEYARRIGSALADLKQLPREACGFLRYLVHSGAFAADDFFHDFELKRLLFTKARCLRQLDSRRAFMLLTTVIVFRIFIYSYLLDYPTVLKMKQSDLSSRNLRSVCSVFYEVLKREIEGSLSEAESQDNVPVNLRVYPAENSPLKDGLKFDILKKSGKYEIIEGLYHSDGVDLVLADEKWKEEFRQSLKKWLVEAANYKIDLGGFMNFQDAVLKKPFQINLS